MKLCGFDIGLDRPFFLIAGPCVLEGEQMAVDIASAKSDGPNLVPLGRMRELLESLVEIDRLVKARPFLEDTING